ncbi:MAG: MATE family efflux transporter, partial [Cyanobacteria bacterium P01_H01_bin.121]
MSDSTAKSPFPLQFSLPESYQEVKACLALAIPLGLAQLLEISMATVDTWMMGMLGSSALAGGALGYTLFRFSFGTGIFTISAVNTVASIAVGENRSDRLYHITIQGLYLSIFLAMPLMAFLGTAASWMHFLGQAEVNILLSESYLKSVLWGLPALFFYEVIRNVLIAV